MKRLVSTVASTGIVLVVAVATASVRDSIEVANTALLLAIVIVAAAVIDWVAGLVTATAGAVALNYFHTEPIHSMRITRTPDVIAVILLVALGASVSAATAFRVTERVRRFHSSVADAALSDLTTKQPASNLWRSAIDVECSDLGLLNARLAPSGTERCPVIARHGRVPDERSSFHELVTIPSTGAVVLLRDPRLSMDLVVEPRQSGSSAEVRRSTILMLADSLELALTHLDGPNGRLTM